MSRLQYHIHEIANMLIVIWNEYNAPYVLESSDEPSFKMYQTKHNCCTEQVTGGHASCATLIRPTNDWTLDWELGTHTSCVPWTMYNGI